MAWQENLQKATFRGVAFEVESDSGKFGRRVQTHEYPQRDKPFTEDLGRATRELSISAFVIGPEYMVQRDALLAALEAPGSGMLVHPWYGQLQVNVKEVSVSHGREKGGMCEFSLVFVEAGELAFPAAADSKGAQTLMATDKLGEVSKTDFLKDFKVDGFPSFVADRAMTDLSALTALAQSGLQGFPQLLANPLSSLLDFADQPSGLADAMLGLFSRATSVLEAPEASAVVGGGGVYARNRNAVLALTEVAGGVQTSAPTSAAPSTRQAQLNAQAMGVLFQRAMLMQAAGMTAVMPMPVYDDAVQVRNSVVSGLEVASETASDTAYVALQELRAKVHVDVTGRLAQSARLMSYTPREVMPALALAYERYEDPERELEIVERNRLRHPGFVPAVALKVLAA